MVSCKMVEYEKKQHQNNTFDGIVQAVLGSLRCMDIEIALSSIYLMGSLKHAFSTSYFEKWIFSRWKSIWFSHFNFILFGINIDYSIHFWLYIQQESIFVGNVCLFPDCKMDFLFLLLNKQWSVSRETFILLCIPKCSSIWNALIKNTYLWSENISMQHWMMFVVHYIWFLYWKRGFSYLVLHAMQCSLYLFILFCLVLTNQMDFSIRLSG